ncbi:MAG: SRPBCC domain-containing protein [Infirmifilum sp.]
MLFESQINIEKNSKQVMNFLLNCENVLRCFRGVENVQIKDRRFSAKVKFDVSAANVAEMSMVTATVDGEYVNVTDNSLEISLNIRIVGIRSKAHIYVNLNDLDESHTLLNIRVDFDPGLIFKMFPFMNNLVNIIYNNNLQDFINCIKTRI